MTKVSYIFALLIVVIFSLSSLQNQTMRKSTMNEINLKLDDKTATKIAEIIFVKIYGEKVLEEKPWIIEEESDFFRIKGTLHSEKGGVAEIEINKRDAKILKIVHGK